MKAVTTLVFLLANVGLGRTLSPEPAGHKFIAAGPGDSRSPCPWLNALANHGYLPRNGRSVTAGQVDKAFQETLNIASGTLKSVIDAGVSTGTRGDGTFDLEDTVKHDVLEHDASFSRNDAAIGDALHFDPNIWNRTLTHFKSDTITINCVAAARLDRIATAQVLNPNFKLTPGGLTATFINHSLWLMTFGNRIKGNANKQFLRVIFEQERLPFKEGFVRPSETVTGKDLMNMVGKLQAATVKLGLSQLPKQVKCQNC